MLAVRPQFSSPDIDRTVAKASNKAKHRDEGIVGTWKVWMPYHRIWIQCQNTATATPEKVVTALNALFCAHAPTERELLQLFRPRHLQKPLENVDPGDGDVTCALPAVDLDEIVQRLIELRAHSQDELTQTEQELVKAYRSWQSRYLLLPVSTRSLEREKQASSKLAKLQSSALAIDICLNLKGDILPRQIDAHDIVYIPMAILQLKQKTSESSRYVLIDLTTGKEDSALTKLCETESNFKSELERSLYRST